MLAIVALTFLGEQARHGRASGVEVTILPAQPIQESRVEVIIYYGPPSDSVGGVVPDAWLSQEMAVADLQEMAVADPLLSSLESGETGLTSSPAPIPVVTAAEASPSSVLPSMGTVSQLSPDEARAVLRRAGWRESLIPQALAVACGIGNQSGFPNGESNCHPLSTNGAYYGLFQIGPSWFDWFHVPFEEWSDPVANARLARWICEDYDIPRGQDCWAQWSVKP